MPEPDGPTTATVSPGSTDRLTSSSACDLGLALPVEPMQVARLQRVHDNLRLWIIVRYASTLSAPTGPKSSTTTDRLPPASS